MSLQTVFRGKNGNYNDSLGVGSMPKVLKKSEIIERFKVMVEAYNENENKDYIQSAFYQRAVAYGDVLGYRVTTEETNKEFFARVLDGVGK